MRSEGLVQREQVDVGAQRGEVGKAVRRVGDAIHHAEHAGGAQPVEAVVDERRGVARIPQQLVELLGAERLIHGRLADAPFIVRTDARLASPSPGQIVGLQIAPESLHWFDPTTQKRLPT